VIKELERAETPGRGNKRPKPRVPASSRPHVSESAFSLITLLTDFGTADYFVAAMKGVILGINPSVRIVDITHEIPAQDIEAGAFTLLAAYASFHAGAIHVAVVDPGVGSARRPILVEAGGHFFIGPDNGIFSYVCQRDQTAKIFELINTDYFRPQVSATFHGRDIFSPVAAALSTGVRPSELGRETSTMVQLEPLLPKELKNGELKARIIHIDRFGNCVTNLTPANLTISMIEQGAFLKVKGAKVSSFRNYFSEQDAGKKEVFGIWSSAGFLELAATNRSAAKILKAKRGDKVIVTCH